MHAPLSVPSREAVCLPEITALVECHERGLIARLSGECNTAREMLNMCLRKERLDRTAKNHEEAKLRNDKKKKAWAALDKDQQSSTATQEER